jgi:hypothetical protein
MQLRSWCCRQAAPSLLLQSLLWSSPLPMLLLQLGLLRSGRLLLLLLFAFDLKVNKLTESFMPCQGGCSVKVRYNRHILVTKQCHMSQ